MGIDLHSLRVTPGSRLPFRRELDAERLGSPSVTCFLDPPVGEGIVANDAGTLTVRATVTAALRCICDRCAKEFEKHVSIPLEVPLAVGEHDGDNPDYFPLDGDRLDIDDLLESGYILEMGTQFLCQEDCKGLCPRCGADLNLGQCSCLKESDPRLAVLEQLLDDIEN